LSCCTVMFVSLVDVREPWTSNAPAPTFAITTVKRRSLWPGIVVVSIEKVPTRAMPRSGSLSVPVELVLICQVWEAGVGSTLPAASFARTWNVCDPAPSPEYDFGLVQTANVPASSLHSYVRLVAGVTSSVPVKPKLAELLVDGLDGPEVILVSGGVVSAPVPAATG